MGGAGYAVFAKQRLGPRALALSCLRKLFPGLRRGTSMKGSHANVVLEQRAQRPVEFPRAPRAEARARGKCLRFLLSGDPSVKTQELCVWGCSWGSGVEHEHSAGCPCPPRLCETDVANHPEPCWLCSWLTWPVGLLPYELTLGYMCAACRAFQMSFFLLKQ